jgi:hypothetical protein
MKKPFITMAAAAAIAAGTSAAASAQSTVACSIDPIKVVHYSVDTEYTQPLPFFGGAPATNVRFAARSGKSPETIVDNGTFSRGSTITHEFAVSPLNGDASQIDVEGMTFADGTLWQRG